MGTDDGAGVREAEDAIARMRRIDRINRRAKLAGVLIAAVIFLGGEGTVIAIGLADTWLGGRAFWGLLFLGGFAGAAVWKRMESKEDPDQLD